MKNNLTSENTSTPRTPDTPDTVKYRVLFVCLGNICRSPAAEELFRQEVIRRGNPDEWIIDSAGTGDWHIGELPDHRMRVHARRRGYELTHHCRQVKECDFGKFDYIIGMDNSNIANLKRLAPTPEDEKKILAMAQFVTLASRYDHIPDPYYEGAEGFELVLDLLENACYNLYDYIVNQK